ncbi:MAG: T9SS type A sorting domain-containing protein [Bacteroidales bacterium]|nr:T9SS type A sorting domain-containing protein [Bacteroidales bacterium]
MHPNPFTTTITIEYELTEPSHVQLTIYNAIGEIIHEVVDRMMPQGKHSFTWTADRLPEGLYYAVMRSEEGVSVVKMVKQ